MSPEKFVSQIHLSVVQQNMEIYKDLLKSATPTTASDLYWKRALAFYDLLSDDSRAVLFDIMRQTSVDAVSSFFAILDGVSVLEGSSVKFELMVQPENRLLNGNLQDLFLELEEDRNS